MSGPKTDLELERRLDEARSNIEHLWPPDSEYSDCAETGKQDMIDALAAGWRSLPLPVLEHMARVQIARDNR